MAPDRLLDMITTGFIPFTMMVKGMKPVVIESLCFILLALRNPSNIHINVRIVNSQTDVSSVARVTLLADYRRNSGTIPPIILNATPF